MAIDRTIFSVPFSKNKPPLYPCPTCHKGILLTKKENFIYRETKASRDAHGDENWEPDWTEYVYGCTFYCNNPNCLERVVSVGKGTIEHYIYDNGKGQPEEEISEYFEPLYFVPHLVMFKIPVSTPSDIKSSINSSFSLFYASPSSAANLLRVAVEQILDYAKIKRYEIKQKKRVLISLHRRIKLLYSSYATLKDSFMAIKWLGNAGSHVSKITDTDVLDAYTIMEHILDELFGKSNIARIKLVSEINRKKGPRRKLQPF